MDEAVSNRSLERAEEMKKQILLVAVCLLMFAPGAFSQSGRVSFYWQNASSKQFDGALSNYSELVTAFSLQSPQDASFEYAIDARASGYPTSEESNYRLSLYNAYVGGKMGNFYVRGGQMWLNELGALGSVGGVLGQYKIPKGTNRQLRFGLFAGLEPEILNVQYVSGVQKFGGFAAFEGDKGRSHIIGYANIRNSGMTERSVMVFTNFLPAGNEFFLYQTAEYDFANSSGLSYFFTNARYAPTKRLELQGTYHRGRSVDYRTITQDQLNGRPVDPEELSGLLYESAEGRATVNVGQGFRVFGGYGNDRDNQTDQTTARTTFGFFSSNLFQSGVDIHFSNSHRSRSDGNSYNSWNVSVGRLLLEKIYLSGEYSSSLSVVRFAGSDDVIVENRPQAKLFVLSALIHLSRSISLQSDLQHTTANDYTENRLLVGVTYRY